MIHQYPEKYKNKGLKNHCQLYLELKCLIIVNKNFNELSWI